MIRVDCTQVSHLREMHRSNHTPFPNVEHLHVLVARSPHEPDRGQVDGDVHPYSRRTGADAIDVVSPLVVRVQAVVRRAFALAIIPAVEVENFPRALRVGGGVEHRVTTAREGVPEPSPTPHSDGVCAVCSHLQQSEAGGRAPLRVVKSEGHTASTQRPRPYLCARLAVNG